MATDSESVHVERDGTDVARPEVGAESLGHTLQPFAIEVSQEHMATGA